ncbi:MAG TPA: NADH-quinone oxidoreductase subunit L, partial [Myxococcaceae bacterium]|nr:NADH-quinone oxidoreductase subunit L [Myxococcaceae bacterium]
LVFEGKRSPQSRVAHAHESDWPMTLPLVILAALSVFALVYGLPIIHAMGRDQTLMENYLSPVSRIPEELERIHRTVAIEEVAGLSDWMKTWAEAWFIALAGGLLAGFLYLWYFPSRRAAPAPALGRALERWARNGFYVDRFYELVITKPVKLISFVLYRVVDSLLIDTIFVRGTAWVTARVASVIRYLQNGDAQSYAAVMALAVFLAAGYALIQVLK